MRSLIAAAVAAVLLIPAQPAFAASDLLPALEPVRSDLARYDLRKSDGKVKLRFIGSVANKGKGGLHVIGKREQRDNKLTAYQRLERTDGSFREVKIGTIVYHDAHNHFHLEGVSRYRLLDSSGNVVRSAPKVTFCLTDSESIGGDGRPIYIQCTPSATADNVKMGITAGWKDVYGKDLPGQYFDVTSLMDKPEQEYILEMTSNPEGILHETHSSPQVARVTVKLGR